MKINFKNSNWLKNNAILQKKLGHWDSLVTEWKQQNREPVFNLSLMTSRKDAEAYSVIKKGETNSYLHSAFDPRKEAKQFSLAFQDKKTLCILGWSLPYLWEELLAKTSLIILEYDLYYLIQLLHLHDFSTLLTHKAIIPLIRNSVHDLQLDFKQHLKTLPALFVYPLGLFSFPWRQKEIDYQRVHTFCQQMITNAEVDYQTQAELGYQWHHNIIKNFVFFSSNLPSEKNKNSSSPPREIAIVAAGPSLEKQLKSLRKESYIVVCDTALPLVSQQKIHINQVFSVDAQIYSYHHFISSESSSPYVVNFDWGSHHALVRSAIGKHPIDFYASAHPLVQWFTDNALIAYGGSVIHSILMWAAKQGVEKIRVYGLDLSYNHGKTYARETYLYNYFENHSHRLHSLEENFYSFFEQQKGTRFDNQNGIVITAKQKMYGYDLQHILRELGCKEKFNHNSEIKEWNIETSKIEQKKIFFTKSVNEYYRGLSELQVELRSYSDECLDWFELFQKIPNTFKSIALTLLPLLNHYHKMRNMEVKPLSLYKEILEKQITWLKMLLNNNEDPIND